MSDVRLSNGSPTLERMDARLSDHPKPSACRNLFGSVDREELRRDLKGHLLEMEEASAAKWGFDFASHQPISNGKFEWKLLDCKDVPTFYYTDREPRSTAKGVCPAGNKTVDVNGNVNCVVVTSPCTENTEISDSRQDQCSGQRKRPACHDPSSQNKRSHTSSDEVSCCPGLIRSTEHTPRKSSPKTQT